MADNNSNGNNGQAMLGTSAFWNFSDIFGLLNVLKVTPEELVAKADIVLTKINSMKKDLEELEARINGTANYWQGETAEAHRAKYSTKKEEVEEGLRLLIADTENLRKMAAVYTATENEAVNISTDLPGDVII
jgi:WXG100 family type VII secretion target